MPRVAEQAPPWDLVPGTRGPKGIMRKWKEEGHGEARRRQKEAKGLGDGRTVEEGGMKTRWEVNVGGNGEEGARGRMRNNKNKE